MKKLKLLDTFSGIGGFSYAAEKLVGGFETTQFIEIDPYCQKVLKKHWPNVPIHDDIKTFSAKPFQFDAVCGGFPCQDISTAGRGKGITQETRSGLFYELIRVIRMVRPKYVILENVAAILNNGLGIVFGELSEAGYDAEWSIISASSLGACHQRSRWWLVAYPKSQSSNVPKFKSSFDKESSTSKFRNSNITTTNTNNYGSSSTKESRSIKKTDGGTEERKNQACQSQGGSESRNSETFQFNVAYPNRNGYQGQCSETRNKVTSRQDSQIIGSTNTSDLERCNNDGKDKGESRIDGNLSRSSDGGKISSTETGRICELPQESNNDQTISRENKNQENNDRTLVSQGQSRVQLSEYRELGRDQTTFENNSIRHRNDNSSEQGMDNKKSNVANTNSFRCGGGSSERRTVSERKFLQREQTESEMGSETQRCSINTSNPNSIRTQSKDYKQNNASWKMPISDGKTKRTLNPNWREYVSEPCLLRGNDGLRGRVDRLKALGNSVVPQVAAIPLQRVKDIHEQLTSVDR